MVQWRPLNRVKLRRTRSLIEGGGRFKKHVSNHFQLNKHDLTLYMQLYLHEFEVDAITT